MTSTFRSFCFYLLFALLLALTVSEGFAAQVKDIRFAHHGEYSRAVIELEGKSSFRIENHSAFQHQLVVELTGVTKAPSSVSLSGSGYYIADPKIQLDSKKKTMRLILKTKSQVSYKYFTLKSPDRIVLDIFLSAEKTKPKPAPKPQETPFNLVASSNGNSRWNQRIVIDPGHGGYHKGGIGKLKGKTVYEKQVTIKVSEKLEKLLKADPRFDVRLTRRADVYMGLAARTEEAARLQGDLFVSLHCNAVDGKAAQKRARGFEIWTWNRNSNHSAAAKAISKLENSEPGVTKENTSILTQMMTDALESQSLVSRHFAKAVHGTYMKDPYFKKYDRGIDSARFKVLENYSMPSILVELGFMTHPEEVKLLFKNSFQDRLAKNLYNGIVRYYNLTDSKFPAVQKNRTLAQSSSQ
jgi:N-acetylmuramoyl-L-alanine amidase